MTPADEADNVTAIFLTGPAASPRGYRCGGMVVMREPGESDADLESRCEAMSTGPGIALWAAMA